MAPTLVGRPGSMNISRRHFLGAVMLLNLSFPLLPSPSDPGFKGLGDPLYPAWQVLFYTGATWVLSGRTMVMCSVGDEKQGERMVPAGSSAYCSSQRGLLHQL